MGSRTGTLGQFAIAYDEGRLIGMLIGTGGVADLVAALTARVGGDTSAVVFHSDDPERLLDCHRDVRSRRPDCFCPEHDHERPFGVTDGAAAPACTAAFL